MNEQEPDIENVVYLDEFPELKKRVWLRRLYTQRDLGATALPRIIKTEFPKPPDDVA